MKHAKKHTNKTIKHAKGSEKWITYPDGVTGETSGYTLSATYAFGNRYLSYIWNTDPEDLNEKYEEFNDNAIKSKALGFVFEKKTGDRKSTRLNSSH